MLRSKKFIFYYFFIILFLSPVIVKSQNVEVLITGIRSTEGQIVIGIFKDDETFQKEEPYISKIFEKKNISNGEMRVKFNLKKGVYGLSLLDDENNDGEMNYNFLGIPSEGFGFSNYYHSGLSRPSFDDFKFIVNDNKKYLIEIKIRYM